MRRLTFAVMAAALAAFAFAGAEKMPVSGTANPLYLEGIESRPWWNAKCEWRLPIVVAEMSTNAAAGFVVEAEVDFGRKVNAMSIRVVTPWETEVASCAEQFSDTRAKVWFKTDLRAAQNRPFFLYFSEAGGGERAKSVATDVRLVETESGYTLANDALTVGFSKVSNAMETMTRFKINGSLAADEFVRLPWGDASCPLRPEFHGCNSLSREFSHRSTVKTDNPFVKTVRFENDIYVAEYTLYSEARQLEYAFFPKDPKAHPLRRVDVNWASGGGWAWDDLMYPSLSGKVNSMRVMLDFRSDSGGCVDYPDLGSWMKEGWYAIRDQKLKTSVGQFFAPHETERVDSIHFTGREEGEWMQLKYDRSPRTEIRGAIFGTQGDASDIARCAALWANPPRVLVGTATPRREIAVAKCDLSLDCVFNYAVPTLLPAGGWQILNTNMTPVVAGSWLENYRNRLRYLGANAAFVSQGFAFTELPVSDDLHARVAATMQADKTVPPVRPAALCRARAEYTRKFIDYLHRDGMSVFYWGQFMNNRFQPWDAKYVRERQDLEIEVSLAAMDLGYDAVWAGLMNAEDPPWQTHLVKQYTRDFWRYPKAQREEFFATVDNTLDAARRLRKAIKAKDPKGKLLLWGCDLGPLRNDKFSIELAGDCDVIQEELMPGAARHFERVKFGSARMRGMFNNERATVYNHFWAMYMGDDWRIGNCDMPFVFGVNGFNQESEDYSQCDQEIVETTADFFRFLSYTGLDRRVAKMTPVKFYTLFRDWRCHRDDIMNDRTDMRKYSDYGQGPFTFHDGQANFWASAKAIQLDFTLNRFLTSDNLKRYPILIVPHNRMLTRDDLKIIVAYAKEGGVAYFDGPDTPAAKLFEKGAEPVAFAGGLDLLQRKVGKGLLVYSQKELSDARANLKPSAPLRRALARLAGRVEPVEVEPAYSDSVDAMLRSDGKDYFLGTYARYMPGSTSAVVRVKLNLTEKGLKVIDLKRGTVAPFTGEIVYEQRHGECAYFLIGSELKMPEFKFAKGGAFGAKAGVSLAKGAVANLKRREKLGDFRPFGAVLFLWESKDGGDNYFVRPEENGMDVKAFRKTGFVPGSFEEALASASLLHIKSPADQHDVLFVKCAAAIREFIARGGVLMFDCHQPSRTAAEFLKSIGVTPPGGRVYSFPGMEQSRACEFVGDPKHQLVTKPWRIDQPWVGHNLNHGNVYHSWDESKQWAPFRPKANHKYAMTIIQEQVLEKGKVCFSDNDSGYTRHYESITYGDNLYSYLLGMDMKEHLEKSKFYRGGPGK